MSGNQIVSFGEYIRHLRENKKLTLRKIATELELDVSTLSKIEKNERNPSDKIMDKLSIIFDVDRQQLKKIYMIDKITFQLIHEVDGIKILKAAEKRIKSYKKDDRE